jgi:DNA-binding NarL/FixJ family response regulator
MGARGYITWTAGVERVREALHEVLDGGVSFPETGSYERAVAILTPRQLEVLKELERGASNKEIGKLLGLSPGTVKIHVNSILKALGVRNRTEAALHFYGEGRACERCPAGAGLRGSLNGP